MRPIVFADMESAPSRPLRLGYLQGPRFLLLLKRMPCCAWTKGRQQEKGAPDEYCVASEKTAELFLQEALCP